MPIYGQRISIIENKSLHHLLYSYRTLNVSKLSLFNVPNTVMGSKISSLLPADISHYFGK